MEADIERIVITAEELDQQNRRLAAEIESDYTGKPVTFVIISNGALMFGCDLVRLISIPLHLDTISASSYIGAESSNRLTIRSQLKLELTGRHVLVVDDICDTGFTLASVVNELKPLGAIDVKTCVLLNKPARRRRDGAVTPDYVGFTIDDLFVVGYGLDYNESYRHLPYIGVLRPTLYS